MSYYGLNGEVISRLEWNALFKDNVKRRVALDEITNQHGSIMFIVSTEWIGVDHGPPKKLLPPMIYETAVFNELHHKIDSYWYPDFREAQNGHYAVLRKLTADDPHST